MLFSIFLCVVLTCVCVCLCLCLCTCTRVNVHVHSWSPPPPPPPPPSYLAERIALFEKLKAKYDTEVAAKERSPIKVTLSNGKVIDGKAWETTPYDVAGQISKGLADNAVIAKVNGVLWDLDRPLEGDAKVEILKFEVTEGTYVCCGLQVVCLCFAHSLTPPPHPTFYAHSPPLCLYTSPYAHSPFPSPSPSVLYTSPPPPPSPPYAHSLPPLPLPGKQVFWHSSAHILGEAMERHYGGCLCYGPPIEDG